MMILKDKSILRLLIVSFLIFLSGILIFLLNYSFLDNEIVFRFDKFNKIFLISEKNKIFFIFAFIFFIFLFNLFLAEILYFKDRFSSYFLVSFNIVLSVLFLFYVLLLLKIN